MKDRLIEAWVNDEYICVGLDGGLRIGEPTKEEMMVFSTEEYENEFAFLIALNDRVTICAESIDIKDENTKKIYDTYQDIIKATNYKKGEI